MTAAWACCQGASCTPVPESLDRAPHHARHRAVACGQRGAKRQPAPPTVWRAGRAGCAGLAVPGWLCRGRKHRRRAAGQTLARCHRRGGHAAGWSGWPSCKALGTRLLRPARSAPAAPGARRRASRRARGVREVGARQAHTRHHVGLKKARDRRSTPDHGALGSRAHRLRRRRRSQWQCRRRRHGASARPASGAAPARRISPFRRAKPGPPSPPWRSRP